MALRNRSIGAFCVLIVLAFIIKAWAGVEGPPGHTDLPVQFTLEAPKGSYNVRDPILLKASLKAMQSVEVCIHPGHLETDFKLDVSRGGYGKLPVPPSAVQLSESDKTSVQRFSLFPGQTQHVVFDLKKLLPLQQTAWEAGDYRVQAKFFLCGKNDASDTVIPAQAPLHFLMVD